MDSSYYKGKIDNLSSFIGSISPVVSKASEAIEEINILNGYANAVVINGEGIDGDSLENVAIPTIQAINEHVSTIIKECNLKIEEYDKLYREALAREEEARAYAAKAEADSQLAKEIESTVIKPSRSFRNFNLLK